MRLAFRAARSAFAERVSRLLAAMIWCFRKEKKINCLDGFKRSSERVRTKSGR
jgi:hypothetical protein